MAQISTQKIKLFLEKEKEWILAAKRKAENDALKYNKMYQKILKKIKEEKRKGNKRTLIHCYQYLKKEYEGQSWVQRGFPGFVQKQLEKAGFRATRDKLIWTCLLVEWE